MPLTAALQSMPLQRRISLLVVAGLVAIFCLLGVVGLVVVRDVTQQTIEQRLVIGRLVASFFDQELANTKETLASFADRAAPTLASQTASPSVGNADAAARADAALGQALVDAPRMLGPFTERLVLMDRKWTVRAALPAEADAALLANLRAMPSVQQAMDRGQTTVSGLVAAPSRASDLSGMEAVVVIAAPVITAGRTEGVVLAVVRPSDPHLSGAVDAAKRLGQTGHAELVDADGMVLASTEPGHEGRPGEHVDFYLAAARAGRPEVLTTPVQSVPGESPNREEHPKGERHVMAYVPLQEAPWGFALGGSEAEMMAPTWRWIRLLGVLAAVCLGAALFLVWLTTRAVVNPIAALTGVAQRLAAGDLDTAVPVGGGDEVGHLGQSFEEMRRRLLAAHRALAIEKSRYEGIVQSMADAVFVVDTSLRITAFNAAAERLTGWSAAEALGRSCLDLCGWRDENDCAVCSYACPLAAGRDAACTDLNGTHSAAPGAAAASTERITCRDGRTVVVATARSCIYGDSGLPVGVVHVVRDISAQEELRRLKDEFISTVSHELRTPLGFIKSYTTTLLRSDTQWRARTARRFLATIDQSADELSELITNLLDLSRIRAGTLAVQPAPIRLDEVIAAVAERSAARLGGHSLVLAVPADLPMLDADGRRIEQVLFNLIDNAAKYAPGGTITVQASLMGVDGFVVVRVSDEGPGIPPEERELVFERFYRGRGAAASAASGSGLGLAICRGLIEAHGGHIWVEGAAGHGTTMTFTLPVKLPANGSEPAAERLPVQEDAIAAAADGVTAPPSAA